MHILANSKTVSKYMNMFIGFKLSETFVQIIHVGDTSYIARKKIFW